MKQVIIFFAFLTLGNFSFSQTENSDPREHFNNLLLELEGSYQIQMVNSRMKPMIDTKLLELIKSKQQQSEEITFFYTDSIRIVIKSKDAVAAGEKFSDDNQIIYVNE